MYFMKKILVLIMVMMMFSCTVSNMNRHGHQKGRKHHSSSFTDNEPILLDTLNYIVF